MKRKKNEQDKLVEQVLTSTEEREEFFRLIYENSINAVFIIDKDGIVKFLNPAAEHLFDIPAEHMIEKLFRFRDYIDKTCEVEIVRPGKDIRLAEMLTLQIKLTNRTLFVIRLHDITELVRLREELRAVAFIDELTGLFNRQGFLTLSRQQLKIASRNKKWLFFVLADVSHMTWINDAFGHEKGDQLLTEIANIFKQVFRNSDIIARVGRNEFAALAIEAHYSSSNLIVTRLMQLLEDYNLKEKHLYQLSLDIGTAFYNPDNACSIDELISRAEASIYAHKLTS
jgi:diguanylate cyclase (GGDEF)-like protein